ncbi:hypothetical protein PoB_005190300 [Plakobranchus ocellatus]|uniref:Uncharacterized protein n=1 Tax=Plakobranchus ocellatus TaxID=259542 RepID=A0AAV4C1U3_9GAST|nr:hypothetical protein PoB_005190300 [Plakobranchus ocellatus]
MDSPEQEISHATSRLPDLLLTAALAALAAPVTPVAAVAHVAPATPVAAAANGRFDIPVVTFLCSHERRAIALPTCPYLIVGSATGEQRRTVVSSTGR